MRRPAGGVQPTTSNLNPAPGQPPTPNAVNVGLSATGQFSIFNRFGNVSVIIDVVGVYDDHNHDDRYYEKSETYSTADVDAALDEKADASDSMFARVTSGGTLIGGTPGTTSDNGSGSECESRDRGDRESLSRNSRSREMPLHPPVTHLSVDLNGSTRLVKRVADRHSSGVSHALRALFNIQQIILFELHNAFV